MTLFALALLVSQCSQACINTWWFGDAQQANPKLKLHELYDLVHADAGLYVSESVEGETVAQLKKLDLPYDDILRTIRRRKTNLIKRHLNIAAQYIDYVGKGVFPYRTRR